MLMMHGCSQGLGRLALWPLSGAFHGAGLIAFISFVIVDFPGLNIVFGRDRHGSISPKSARNMTFRHV